MLAAISYDPLVFVQVGPLRFSPHGLGIAVGFLIGAWLMRPKARSLGMADDTLYAVLTRAAIGSIVGARVAYVVNHLGDYDSPLEILQVWRGGISLLGGIFGAIALALPEMRRRGLSFWKVMDAAAPGLALGIVVGRIGDLIVADHLGKPTAFFLGYTCPQPPIDTASPCPPGVVVHQTALYDLLLTAVLLGVLLALRRRERFDGFLICAFGAQYGAQRVVEDFLREDLRRFGLTGSQWTAVATIVLCLYVLLIRRRTPWWGRWDRAAAEAELPEQVQVPASSVVAPISIGEPARVESETPAPTSDPTESEEIVRAEQMSPATLAEPVVAQPADVPAPIQEHVVAGPADAPAPETPTTTEPQAPTAEPEPISSSSDAPEASEPPAADEQAPGSEATTIRRPWLPPSAEGAPRPAEDREEPGAQAPADSDQPPTIETPEQRRDEE